MSTNYYTLVNCVSGLSETDKSKLHNYFEKTITYINEKYKHEDIFKKQLMVYIIKSVFRTVRLDSVESVVDEWFSRAVLSTNEMIAIKESYVHYTHDNDLYWGLVEKFINEKLKKGDDIVSPFTSLFSFIY